MGRFSTYDSAFFFLNQIGATAMTEKENITLQPHDTCYFHNESFEDYLSMENCNKKLRHREIPLTANKL